MTATTDRAALDAPVVPRSKGKIIVDWITSTDHKTIGYMYLIGSFFFFCVGGVMALIIRLELFEPGMQIIETKEQYNQLFTMHGTLMPADVRDSALRRLRQRHHAGRRSAPRTSRSPGSTPSHSGSTSSAASSRSRASSPRRVRPRSAGRRMRR